MIKRLSSILCALILVFSSVTSASDFKIMTEELKPFGYYEQGKLTGVCVEIVRELLEDLSLPDTIEVYPWDRAYRETQNMPNRILFAMGRNEAREPLFKWVGPLLDNTTYFYKRKNSPVSINSIEDARIVDGIAVRKNYFTHTHLKNLGFSNLYVTREEDLGLRMLIANRVDLVAIGELGLKPYCERYELDCSAVENTGVAVYESKLYIAFSKDTQDRVIKRWQKSLDDLKQRSAFKRIIDKYTQ